MTIRKANLRLQQLERRDVPASTFLGPADSYNAMVFGNFSSQYCDTQGALAVGGNATLTGYSVGNSLPSSSAGLSLVVGGNLNFTNGEVANGSAEVGGSVYTSSFGIPNGSILSGQYINFSWAKSQLDGTSAAMAAVAPTGSVINNYGSLTLVGHATGPNFFNLTAGELANCHGITIDVPKGSSVIINVSGSNVKMSNFGINLNGASESNVVWNFDQAQTLTLSSIGIPGNVLAPYASVNFNNGQINGTLVAENFCGDGQLNWVAPTCSPCSISGSVCQNSGGGLSPEASVFVTLTGTASNGAKISETTYTDAAGYFDFWYVPVGEYTLTITSPTGSTVTSWGGSSGGTGNGSSITSIYLGSGTHAYGYQFDIA